MAQRFLKRYFVVSECDYCGLKDEVPSDGVTEERSWYVHTELPLPGVLWIRAMKGTEELVFCTREHFIQWKQDQLDALAGSIREGTNG